MVNINRYDIQGNDDFELNIQRRSLLRYHISSNDLKEPSGIVFLIPGFGEDSQVNYQRNLMKYLSEKFNVVAVFVEYHSIFSRKTKEKESCIIDFSEEDVETLIEAIQKFNIQLDENKLDIDNVLKTINKSLDKMKQSGKIEDSFILDLWATMYPYKGEYQNFGVLQAVDILTVLYHMKSTGYKDIIEKKPIIAQGSSHGGYIANLLIKFAPNTFDAIIDNSCYVKSIAAFIVGYEYDKKLPEYKLQYPNMKLNLFTYSHWTLKETPYKFNKNHFEIRELINTEQFNQFCKYGKKTKVISYHSKFDDLAFYDGKLEYMNLLDECGYETKFITIDSEDQIDGKLIKNIKHAMGMSVKELLNTELPELLKIKTSKTDLDMQSIVKYKTHSANYIFDYNENELITIFNQQ